MTTVSQGQVPPLKKVQKTNVLTGAASTSYQLPVIWAGQYMGLVGYQVQKENEENEKRLQQLQDLAKQATQKKAEKKKTQVTLPMRGRRMFMMDKISDQYIKAEVCKRDIEDRIIAFQKDQRQIEDLQLGNMRTYQSAGGDLESVANQVARQADELNRKSKKELFHTLKTKTFAFAEHEAGPRQYSAHDAYPERNLMSTTDFLQNKIDVPEFVPKPGAFSVARHQALFSSSDDQSSHGLISKVASLREHKAKGLDVPAMSDRLAQSQALNKNENPIKQVNVMASHAFSQGNFSSENKASVQNFNQ